MSRGALVGLLLLCAGCGGQGAASESSVAASSASAPVSASASVSASAPASAPAPPSDPLSGAAILRDATFLSTPEFRGRGSASEDEARAGAWIAARLDEANVATLDGGRTQPFEFGPDPESKKKSANILGAIHPEDGAKGPLILLGAHYDHVGFQRGKLYPGAEDNASGTAVVLAIARALVKRRGELQKTVVVAFFGAEEVGLKGSWELVRTWPFDKSPVALMVNVDMIGRPLVDQPMLWVGARALGVLKDVDPDRSVGALLPEGDAALVGRVRAACAAEGLRAVTIGDMPESLRPSVEAMAKGRGDHYPFERRGIPFVFFSSGESADYHEPSDVADRLDGAILEQRARAILGFVVAESRR